MTSAAETLRPFHARREKNLEFFKEKFPGIYEHFWNYTMKKAKLNILTETNEVDILEEGLEGTGSIYKGRAKAYACNEVDKFEQAYGPGSQIVSVEPPYANQYGLPRFFAGQADQLVKKSPLSPENFNHYWLEDFYPCVVFMGVGPGYHIEEFLRRHQVNSLLVMEPNMDYFAASLYAIDWEKICSQFSSTEGTSIHLLVGGMEDDYIQWAMVWNNVIRKAPAFPITTLFYNHRGLKCHDDISEKICDDLYIYLMSWGNYDDEVNQMNQAVHNFTRGVKLLPKASSSLTKCPVFVVGSGPSLDDRLDQIVALQDQALVISCGSAITALHTKGIKPDIHIELESDYKAVVGQFEIIADPEYLKSLRIIGPSHLNPLAFETFGERRCYFKGESGLSKMFGKFGEIIEGGTPTCTNLGFAFAVHYGFEQIFLFGMDFGFPSTERHHASGAIYFDDNAHGIFKRSVDYDKHHVFHVDAYDGSDFLTQPAYFTAKRKVEFLIKGLADRKIAVHNCSNGAAIVGAQWFSRDEFQQRFSEIEHGSKQEVLDYLFGDTSRCVPLDSVTEARDHISILMRECESDIESILDVEITDLNTFNRVCNRVNWYFEEIVQRRAPEFYFMLRGTVRHFLYIGYSHAFALRDQVYRNQFIKDWQEALKHFFHEVQPHYHKVMYKHFDMNTDPWVSKSINDAEEIERIEKLHPGGVSELSLSAGAG